MKLIQLFNEDNIEVMKRLPNESIDVICIDPPYLYLKGQKLERPFDEQLFFSECQRLLAKKGFIVMFGRGVSFYRWNCILADLGFEFKEEIIWNKRRITSPALALGRLHETVSIFAKDKGKINATYSSYMENKAFDLDRIFNDIKRVESTLKNENLLNHIKEGLKNGIIADIFYNQSSRKFVTSYNGNKRNKDIGICTLKTMIENKCKETSIINDFGEKYKMIHPTQKPVRLLERLLALVIPKDKEPKDIVVADFFAGSMSCMEAVYNMGMQGIACEIDKEYFDSGKQRIESLKPKLAM